MKPAVLLTSLSMGGLAAAQQVQSKPFKLIVQSEDKELNGRAFNLCHEGAAIESVCLYKDSSAIFHLNTTQGAQPGPGGLAGYLTSDVPAKPPIPSSMIFYTEPSTNVAIAFFYPGSGPTQLVGFDEQEHMNVVTTLDDTTSPPNDSTPRVLKNWYVCTTHYTSYTYKNTLNWVMGNAMPQNPSCVKVDVKRKFV
ncbi:hypothetical protein C2857_004194 [Epichloe festucae Fl1]|uniref:DUF7907 domain-containing protein n=1 Tax=Epichloe festucae (strain Fl1) TaxID=877507 RepID=A0A7S9PTV7_EPIFF|nr:hypothetical protein C2857_004194 [Epichloe festucae Fl1]